MDEKTKSENGKLILSKANKVSMLIFAIFLSIIFALNLYLDLSSKFRRQLNRQIECNQIAIINSQFPSSDIDSYLARKVLFEKACLERTERTNYGSYFLALASFGFLGYVTNLFRQNTTHKQNGILT